MDSAATITRPATGEASPGSSRVTGAAAGAKRTENATRATSKPLKPIAAHAKVITSRRAASRLREGHVWVYRSEIISENATQPGALVHIEDERGKFLGTALYSSSSQIALRKLTGERLQNQQQLLELLRQRVRTALAYRQWLLQAKDTNAAPSSTSAKTAPPQKNTPTAKRLTPSATRAASPCISPALVLK